MPSGRARGRPVRGRCAARDGETWVASGGPRGLRSPPADPWVPIPVPKCPAANSKGTNAAEPESAQPKMRARPGRETLATAPRPGVQCPIVDPIRTYDYLALARRRVLDWVRPLNAEQYAREFPFGHGTLGSTLTHILVSEWYYVLRIARADVPPHDHWPIREEQPPPFVEIESRWAAQATRTRDTLAAVRDWNTDLEYQVTDDDGRPT